MCVLREQERGPRWLIRGHITGTRSSFHGSTLLEGFLAEALPANARVRCALQHVNSFAGRIPTDGLDVARRETGLTPRQNGR